MTTGFIIWICGVHWFADFVCQTNQQAINKSSSNVWLSRHVLTYTLFLFLIPFWKYHAADVTDPIVPMIFAFVFLNAGLHWLTDYITSRLNKKLWQYALKPGNNPHWFFTSVGFDQYIHYICLFTTANWLLVK